MPTAPSQSQVSPREVALAARSIIAEQREAVGIVARCALEYLDAGDLDVVRDCLRWLNGEEVRDVTH